MATAKLTVVVHDGSLLRYGSELLITLTSCMGRADWTGTAPGIARLTARIVSATNWEEGPQWLNSRAIIDRP